MKMSGEGNSAGLNGSQRKVPTTNPFKIASSKTVKPTQSNDNNNISEALEANLDLDDDFEWSKTTFRYFHKSIIPFIHHIFIHNIIIKSIYIQQMI